MESREVEDAVLAATGAQREALWRLRESIPEAQRHEGASLKHDVAVDPGRLPAFIVEGEALLSRLAPGARLVAYGHLGDGNLHYNLSEPAGGDGELGRQADAIRRAVHDLVAAHGGSFSAEHGIGQSKVGELERYEDPAALGVMRAIKRALDPKGIMNPGKVLRDQPMGAPGRRSRRKP
jgi:FAD/FMN-containing dehydrogenase